jgi:hypothetical protein
MANDRSRSSKTVVFFHTTKACLRAVFAISSVEDCPYASDFPRFASHTAFP